MRRQKNVFHVNADFSIDSTLYANIYQCIFHIGQFPISLRNFTLRCNSAKVIGNLLKDYKNAWRSNRFCIHSRFFLLALKFLH